MWTNTSFPPSLGWMKPKPFCPLNHLTVPVRIFFSKAHLARQSRDSIQLSDDFGKEPAGAFKKAQRQIEYWKGMGFRGKMQGTDEIPMRSGRPFNHLVG